LAVDFLAKFAGAFPALGEETLAAVFLLLKDTDSAVCVQLAILGQSACTGLLLPGRLHVGFDVSTPE